jgi:hypothetical protein
MSFQQGHALLIGTGTHQYHPKLDVPITVKDAQAVQNVLQDANACGYPESQVNLVHDAGASKNGILSALDKLAATKPDDTVFLFYCGHGALGADGKYYLVSYDARVQNGRVVPGSGVSEEELLARLKAVPAQRVLMILNACFSGNVSPTLDISGDTLTPSVPDEDSAAAILGTGKGRIIITATREGQESYIGAGNLTIFTQALVDGLKGKGVGNSNGYVSAFRLYEHIFIAVSEYVQEKHQATQEPELTVLKGIGPFAVSLYKGATSLGTFDESETPPAETPVREISEKKVQRVSNKITTKNQSGGINISGGARVTVGRDMVGGDKIEANNSQGFINKPQGPVNQRWGNEVNTGGGSYVGGNLDNRGGQFAGRDATQINNVQGASKQDLQDLVTQLRTMLQQVPLDADEKKAVETDLASVEEQIEKPEPKLTLIKRGLNGIKDVLESAAGAAVAAAPLVPLVQRGLEMAQQLFK